MHVKRPRPPSAERKGMRIIMETMETMETDRPLPSPATATNPANLRGELADAIEYRNGLAAKARTAQDAFDHAKHLLCDAVSTPQPSKPRWTPLNVPPPRGTPSQSLSGAAWSCPLLLWPRSKSIAPP